jgi:hypothetical protein
MVKFRKKKGRENLYPKYNTKKREYNEGVKGEMGKEESGKVKKEEGNDENK